MDFLDISSLGAAYRYVVKIKEKFRQKNKWDSGPAHPPQKQGKGNPCPQNTGQGKDNQSSPQAKKWDGKTKKDTGKWCEFHKIPWHNTDECRSKQSLVAEIKSSESDPDSDSEPNATAIDNGRQIIDADPTATVATAQIQLEDPEESKAEEHLFHSQMWVKGMSLHFVVDNDSQKNLISAEVVKRLELSTTPHPQPYNISWLIQWQGICVTQQCHLPYGSKPFKDEVLCNVDSVMLF